MLEEPNLNSSFLYLMSGRASEDDSPRALLESQIEEEYSQSTLSPSNGIAGLHLTADSIIVTDRSGSILITPKTQISYKKSFKTGLSKIWCQTFLQNNTFFVAGGLYSSNSYSILHFSIDKLSLKCLGIYDSHKCEVNILRLSKDQRFLYSSDDMGYVIKWNLEDKSNEIVAFIGSMVLGMDINESGTEIAVGVNGGIRVFSTQSPDPNKVLRAFEGATTTIWTVKVLWKHKKIQCIGGDEQDIYLWSKKPSTPKVYKGHEKRIRIIVASEDEKMLVTGSYDCSVLVWNINVSTKPIILIRHTSWVRCIIIDPKLQLVYSAGDDCKIKAAAIPQLSDYFEIPNTVDLSSVHSISQSQDNTHFALCTKNFIFRMNLDSGNQNPKDLGELVNIVLLSTDMQTFYAFSKISDVEDFYSKITRFNYDDTEWIESESTDGIYLAEFSKDEKTLICVTRQSIDFFCAETLVFKDSKSLKWSVTQMIILKDNMAILEVQDLSIFKFDFAEKGCEVGMINQNPSIQMKVSDDGVFLFVYSNKLQVYLVENLVEVACIKIEEVVDIVPHFQNKHFLVHTKQEIYGFSLDTFQKAFVIYISEGINKISLNETSMKMLILSGNSISAQNIDLIGKDKEISYIGTESQIPKFKDYLRNLVSNKVKFRDANMEKILILPDGKNALHYYVECDKPEFLVAALVEYGGFIKSKDGTPLDIAYRENNSECMKKCLTYIKIEQDKLPLLLSSLNDAFMTNLNYQNEGVSRFFRIGMQFSIGRYPVSGYETQFLPEIFPPRIDSEESKLQISGKINCMQTYFPLPCISGSSESIKALELLVSHPDEKLFNSFLIKEYLLYKMDQVWQYIWGRFLLYLAYMVLISVYTIEEYKNKGFLIAPFILNLLILSYEIVKIINSSGMAFVGAGWNIVEIVRTFLMFLYSIMIWSDYSEDLSALLAFLLLTTWLRGISYFRLFSPTRYYINLILQVCYDIIPFLLIFFYSTYAFAMISQRVSTDQQTVYFNYLTAAYELSLGSSDSSGYSKLEYLFFFLNCLVNPIIMLNLLVAVMGDTYGDVKAKGSIIDMIEFCKVILDAEEFMFWNQKKNQSMYMFKNVDSNEAEGEDMGDSVSRKLKKMKLEQIDLFETQEKIMKMNKETFEMIEEINKKLAI